MTKALIVYVTVRKHAEASKIAQALVEERLAACVSFIPEIDSRYWWEGRIRRGKEVMLIMKTFPRLYKALEKRILQMHSYEVPEILALPVVEGNPAYFKWMKDFLK